MTDPRTDIRTAFPRQIVADLIHIGAPISLARQAEILGDVSPNHTTTHLLLDSWKAPERDTDGAITACGVSLAPTPISFTLGGRQLYTWCTLDTLVFPRWAGVFPADVTTTAEGMPTCEPSCGCSAEPQGTSEVVSWRVTADGVTDLSHPDIHIVAVTHYGSSGVRCCFCNSIRTFVNRDAAAAAQAKMEEKAPGSTVLWSLAEAWAECEGLIDDVLQLSEL